MTPHHTHIWAFPASLWLLSSGPHPRSSCCLLGDHLPPARPTPEWLSPGNGCSLGMWVGPPGAAQPFLGRCWTEASVWSWWVLSWAQTHDWTSENAAHYPAHRAQRGHAGARQPRRPGWVHGGPRPRPSLLRPLHRGQACAGSWERASPTHRNENHFLQPHGRQRQRAAPEGSSSQARAGHPS